MLIKITWSNGNTEMCSAFQSIAELTRNYFGGGMMKGVTVESAETPAPAPAPAPAPVAAPEVPDVPRVKRKKPADA